MKTIQHVSILFLTLICLNTYAQENPNSIDSLRTEIVTNLNHKKWSFLMSYPNQEIRLLKLSDTIRIKNNNLIFNDKDFGTVSINLLEQDINFKNTDNEEKIWFGEYFFMNRSFKKGKELDKHTKMSYLLAVFQDSYTKLQQANELQRLAAFQIIAANYKALSEKPTITEEQRKYIVQANSKNEKKEYNEALDLYKKVINVNPISYPSAYNNMALLAAQVKDYQYAIFNMKKYLMLVPEAEDARAAQDKIYEWEAEIGK